MKFTLPSRRRQQPINRKLDRTRRFLLEQLEDRLAPAGLYVSLAEYELPEGAWTTGTVFRDGDLSQDLTVYLSSSDTTEAAVPPSVTIPAGQASADFPVAAEDDAEADGVQQAIITAEANMPPGFDLLTASGQPSMTRTIATLPDGRFVTAGLKYVGPSPWAFDVAVHRFLPGGQVDSSFGGGMVVVPVVPGHHDTPTVVLPQNDGKILVAGYTAPEGGSSDTDMFVLRFNTNGTLDNTFGTGGRVVLDFPAGWRGEVHDLTFGPNGSIYLAGLLDQGGNWSDFAVVRLTSSGAYDPTWGNGGLVTTDFFYADTIYEAVPQADGKLLVVGQAGGNSSSAKLALARYHTNGQLDTTFGGDGTVEVDVPGSYEALTDFIYLPGGKILAVGKVQPPGATSDNPYDWVLAQFNSNGALDGTFGQGGIVTHDFGGDDQAMVLQKFMGDTIIVAGYGAGTIQESSRKPILVQFNPYGYQMSSMVVQRNDALAYDLVYQDSKLRLAGSSSSPSGGFVDTYFPNGGQWVTAYETLNVTDTDATGPVVQPDAYDLGEDETFTSSYFGVVSNDYSLNGELTASVVTGPAHGTLNLSPTGGFTYTPDPNYFGPDSFVYRATDTLGLSGDATVSLTVWNMDDRIQVTVPGPQMTAEDTPLSFSAANGTAITITDIESPRVLVALWVYQGILTLPSTAGLEFPYPDSVNNSQSITFYADNPAEANAALDGLIVTPNANVNGQIHLDITVRDETYVAFPVEDSDWVPINVTPVNDAPVAAADSYEWYEDETLTVWGMGVLGNDADVEWDMLSASLVSGPAHGTVTVNPSGGFTYTPHPNFFGADSFVYRATDPGGLSSTATVSLTIHPMNDPTLVVGPGPQTIAEDTSLTLSAANGNAVTITDVESPPLLVHVLVQNGILTLPSTAGVEFPDPEHLNNSSWITFYADTPAEANAALDGLVFTPNANYHGSLILDVVAHDTTITYPTIDPYANVYVTVTPVNDAPVAEDDFYWAEAGVPFITTWGGGGSGLTVLINDHDADGEPLIATLVSGPAHGTLEFNADGTFTYTAEATYSGTDSFTYRASDGELETGLATATFTVARVNHAPVATGESFSVDEDTLLTIGVPGLLGNDSDPDGDSLVAVLWNPAAHGTVVINAGGSFTYTPHANYHGSDSFTYRADDGQAFSNLATVTITVNPVHDAPVAVNDSYSINEDQTLTIAPTPGVTSLTMVSQPGDWVGQGQTYSFTPQTGTFTAHRNFDEGVSIHYSGAGPGVLWWDLDFAAPLNATLTPGTYLNATRWPFQAANVPGLDVSGEGRGSNTLTGQFTVTQALYAADGKVLRFAATFEQHSEGAAPALTGAIKFNQGNAPSGILINDVPGEGGPLTIIVVSGPAHGTLAMNVDGSFIYTPSANYHGADSFSYKLSDGVSESNVATVSLTVNSLNDFPTANHDTYFVAEDSVLNVAAPGVLANDSDVDGDSLTATLISSPTHGALSFNADGSFTYTPHANYYGADSFQYAARDTQGWFSFIRTVTLNVFNVNDAPIAADDSYTTAEDTPLTVAAPGLRGNDTDIDSNFLTALLVSGPDHGSLTLNSNGSFTYTPDANYHGPDSFTYKARDGQADSNTATVSLTVTAVNDAPTAADDAYAVDEDGSLTVDAPGVLGNDSDVEGDGFSAVLVSGPAHGTLTFNADGSFGYTPDANYHGSDSFTYKASDGSAEGNIATVSLTVSAVNDAPTAGDDAYALDEDQTLTVAAPGVLGNDSDIDGASLSAVLVSGPAHGTLTLNADGSLSYAPHANYHGSDSFTYKASDASVDSNVATVSLTINAVNDAPTAADNAYAVDEDGSLTVVAAGVLGNDGDVDGDTLSAVLVSGPAHGSLTLNADGSLSYAPHANYHGSDSFTYKASDGAADSNVATAALTINAVNDAPTATDDAYAVDEDASLTVAADGVLGNDGDVEGDALSAVLVSGPAHGTLTLNADGSLSYAPDANYHGSDSFTYKASDGAADSNVVTVSLTVNAVNDAPTAADNAYAVDEDGSLTVAAPGVLGNDSDVEGDALSAVLVTGPAHGTLTPNADGSFTYTPHANYHGSDSFTYKANDGSADSNVATVSLTVNSVNDAPTAADDAHAVDEDQSLTVAAPGVLGNDGDVDGDALSAVLVSGPAHGALTLNGDGSFTYTPHANYHGSDSFTYKASDGSADSNVVTVSLTVSAVNDAPTAADNAYAVDEDGSLTVALPGVLGNDGDVDGDALSAVLVSGPAHGALTLNSDGSFTYTPDANYHGSDSFTYKASDGSADSNVVTVPLTVNAVNDAPVAVPGPDAANVEGATTTFSAAGSFDVDGDSLSYLWNFGDGNTASGFTVEYAHADQGTYIVKLTVSDGVASTTESLILTVSNGAPLATVSGPASGVRGQARSFLFQADDPSPVDDAAGFTFSINWGDGNIQNVTGLSGQLVDHAYAANGTYLVRVTATDKDGAVSSFAEQSITISTVQMQGGDLVVGGTTGNDTITLKVADTSGGVRVTIGGSNLGTFNPSGRILVYGQAGTDNIKFETTKFGGVTRYITDPAVVFGDAGGDTLDARGSSASNVLVGGAGNDTIYGGLGRDLLLGGAGVDTLRGGAGEDALVGNATAHDANLNALLALMAEWGRTDADYATRTAHLSGTPGGFDGAIYLDPVTSPNDSAIDQLYGESGQDLFFATFGSSADSANDDVAGESVFPV